MAGATIDHIVALTIFLAALLVFIGLFNQTNQTAILYQYHTYIATQCSNMLDSVLLNPGSPSDWGISVNSTQNLGFFGLQDPQFQQYATSSFSTMRLLSPAAQQTYNGTTYNNLLWNQNGGFLLLNTSQCVSYSTASSLLEINGTLGFQLAITPTLTVNVSQALPATDLRLLVQVHGPGFPFSNSSLSYLMFWANTSSGGYPVINNNFASNSLQANSSGACLQDFSSLSNKTAFTFIVEASEGGLSGIGYSAMNTLTSKGNLIPYVSSFDNGTANVIVAQNATGTGPLYFNASFYVLPSNFAPILSGNYSGILNSGGGTPSQTLIINTTNQTGFLVIAYTDGSNFGTVIMPLGIGTLGIPATFGSSPSGAQWVATDLRQILIGSIAYQAKLSLWSLQSQQVMG